MKVFDYRNQCYNVNRQMWKVRYDTKQDAKRAAKKLVTHSTVNGILKAYKCPHCDYFHLGNPVDGIQEDSTV